jgi:hypothetical protein
MGIICSQLAVGGLFVELNVYSRVHGYKFACIFNGRAKIGCN